MTRRAGGEGRRRRKRKSPVTPKTRGRNDERCRSLPQCPGRDSNPRDALGEWVMDHVLARKDSSQFVSTVHEGSGVVRRSPQFPSDKPPGIPTALWGRLASYRIPREEPCIYLLLLEGQVVYVGQTVLLPDRIAAHRLVMRFEEVLYFVVPWGFRAAYEGALIRYFRPKFNRQIQGGDAAEDRDVLADLGLLDIPSEEREALRIRLREAAAWYETVRSGRLK